jgi:hypothetical protein
MQNAQATAGQKSKRQRRLAERAEKDAQNTTTDGEAEVEETAEVAAQA